MEDFNGFRWIGWRMLFRGIGDGKVMALLFLKVDFQGRLRFDGKGGKETGGRIIWRAGTTILGVRWKIGLPNAEVDMG